MIRQSHYPFLILLVLDSTNGFIIPSSRPLTQRTKYSNILFSKTLYSQSTDNDTGLVNSEDDIKRSLSAAPLKNDSIDINMVKSKDAEKNDKAAAKTNTVNERLIAELQAATEAERGPKTNIGKKFKDNFRYTEKTDEEREAALEAARDLNGVNPTVTVLASFFAFGMAYGFWSVTQFLAELFLTHPVSADAPYAFTRAASVFRNVVMGLSSLASGFSLVSGLGVFLLGVRVAYGEWKKPFFLWSNTKKYDIDLLTNVLF